MAATRQAQRAGTRSRDKCGVTVARWAAAAIVMPVFQSVRHRVQRTVARRRAPRTRSASVSPPTRPMSGCAHLHPRPSTPQCRRTRGGWPATRPRRCASAGVLGQVRVAGEIVGPERRLDEVEVEGPPTPPATTQRALGRVEGVKPLAQRRSAPTAARPPRRSHPWPGRRRRASPMLAGTGRRVISSLAAPKPSACARRTRGRPRLGCRRRTVTDLGHQRGVRAAASRGRAEPSRGERPRARRRPCPRMSQRARSSAPSAWMPGTAPAGHRRGDVQALHRKPSPSRRVPGQSDADRPGRGPWCRCPGASISARATQALRSVSPCAPASWRTPASRCSVASAAASAASAEPRRLCGVASGGPSRRAVSVTGTAARCPAGSRRPRSAPRSRAAVPSARPVRSASSGSANALQVCAAAAAISRHTEHGRRADHGQQHRVAGPLRDPAHDQAPSSTAAAWSRRPREEPDKSSRRSQWSTAASTAARIATGSSWALGSVSATARRLGEARQHDAVRLDRLTRRGVAPAGRSAPRRGRRASRGAVWTSSVAWPHDAARATSNGVSRRLRAGAPGGRPARPRRGRRCSRRDRRGGGDAVGSGAVQLDRQHGVPRVRQVLPGVDRRIGALGEQHRRTRCAPSSRRRGRRSHPSPRQRNGGLGCSAYTSRASTRPCAVRRSRRSIVVRWRAPASRSAARQAPSASAGRRVDGGSAGPSCRGGDLDALAVGVDGEAVLAEEADQRHPEPAGRLDRERRRAPTRRT